MPSFDVVSTVQMHEVKNAVDQVRREVASRYDLKGTSARIELQEKDGIVELWADQELHLKALQELLRQKLAKRGVSLKSVQFNDPAPAGGDMQKQEIVVKQGLKDEELRRLNKLIKDRKFKANSQIQGDQLRVSGKKKDDLQEIINYLKAQVTDIELQFTNYRD